MEEKNEKEYKKSDGYSFSSDHEYILVMPAFASQTSNTDEATEVQEQNEQTDANGSADTANDTQTTGSSSDRRELTSRRKIQQTAQEVQ